MLTALISAIVSSTITVFASGPGAPFKDVDENAYYADAVYHMRGMRVIEGYANGNFGPDDFVTRGQLATVLDRYDSALLTDPDNTGTMTSGVADLQTLLCSEAIDFSSESEHIQNIHERLCTTDGDADTE